MNPLYAVGAFLTQGAGGIAVSPEAVSMRALSDDLAQFARELTKIAAFRDRKSKMAMQSCEQYFSDLPERIREAIVGGHCAFVERLVEGRWQYLLQHGDFMVCDNIPGQMRNTIIKPIIQYLTPLGSATEIIWYCMD